ncbi:hypothetical protein GIB67_020444 [Kingdonia uniflora]|uniref:WRKY domain-containing protein n=1 Tax=Kingdonia uniflora TaxID=39325 RepID=A0A7J7LUZ1_9MAGN|nr:hypothetical protein GIB67_020444 [Kingdonia uniflora]
MERHQYKSSHLLAINFSPNPSLHSTTTRMDDEMKWLSLLEDVSDYLLSDPGSSEEESTLSITCTNHVGCASTLSSHPIAKGKGVQPDVRYPNSAPTSTSMKVKFKSGVGKKRKTTDDVVRVAFKTQTEKDVMDDGFKWRKYGKKQVKNNPNPRNYYRCSSVGCSVKKRVERDSEDSSYVITTYDGVHNHESPCVIYYNETPFMVPNGWTLQASHHSSTS